MRFYTNVKQIGNNIYVRGYEESKSFVDRIEYHPTVFLRTKEKTKYKTLQGDCLQPINPGNIWETKQFIERYKGVDNFEIFGDISPVNQYISDSYPEETIEFDINKIKIYIIDIETTSTYGFPNVEEVREEVLLITIQDFRTKKTYTWGTRQFSEKVENNVYYECKNEYELFQKFIEFWESDYPEIISGWNIELFDIPYLIKRIQNTLGESNCKLLSPWKLVSQNDLFIGGKKYISYEIFGVTQLDYLNLYKKFTYTNQESYRLDYIAETELGTKKIDHSEFETFKDFYTNNWSKFVKYNIIDTNLVYQLENKLKLIELAITLAYDAKSNYSDVFFQVRMWDSIIYNYLKRNNICIPAKKSATKDTKYTGAYVKEPVAGIYDWVVSLDLTSLYPSLIMQYNISPETLLNEKYLGINVDKLLNLELNLQNLNGKCVCANGSLYDTTKKGIFPQLIEKIFEDRQTFKLKMLAEKSKLQEIEHELKSRGVDLNFF